TSYSGGTIQTGTGELSLNEPLIQNGTPFQVGPLLIRGNLRLPSGFHELQVPASHCCSNDVVIEATIHGPGTLYKTGGGTLQLNGANDYTGLTLINGGVVSINNGGALGTTDSATIVNDGATLWLNFGGGTVNEQLNIRGAGLGGTNGALR